MTSDTAKLKERARSECSKPVTTATGVSMLDGYEAQRLMKQLVDEIDRLEAEREEVCRIIAGNTKIANLPPYIQSLCNSLDDAETERDEAVGLLETVTSKFERGGAHMQDYQRARAFIAKHKEAGANE